MTNIINLKKEIDIKNRAIKNKELAIIEIDEFKSKIQYLNSVKEMELINSILDVIRLRIEKQLHEK